MEHQAYSRKDLKKPSFFQRVLGQKIKENALIEINNLLSDKDFASITVEEVHAIAEKYGVNLETDYDDEVSGFYKAYLSTCLKDKYISKGELEDLKQLKYLLGLNDKEVDEIHHELAGEIYKMEVEKVIEDGELDESERGFIEQLQNDLKLPDEVAQDIYETSGQELIRRFMNDAIADARLTPEEEKQLYAIAQNLNAEMKLDDATKTDLEKYKLYWQIENDDMPELVVDINIPRSEKCYYIAENAQWHDHLKTPGQKNYSRSSLTLKIAKGLYWRGKEPDHNPISTDEWKVGDTGTLYLTNKRIFFKGQQGDKVILLSRIMDFIVFSNGIEIYKEADQNQFLEFERNSDIFAMLLGKAISQLRG